MVTGQTKQTVKFEYKKEGGLHEFYEFDKDLLDTYLEKAFHSLLTKDVPDSEYGGYVGRVKVDQIEIVMLQKRDFLYKINIYYHPEKFLSYRVVDVIFDAKSGVHYKSQRKELVNKYVEYLMLEYQLRQ